MFPSLSFDDVDVEYARVALPAARGGGERRCLLQGQLARLCLHMKLCINFTATVNEETSEPATSDPEEHAKEEDAFLREFVANYMREIEVLIKMARNIDSDLYQSLMEYKSDNSGGAAASTAAATAATAAAGQPTSEFLNCGDDLDDVEFIDREPEPLHNHLFNGPEIGCYNGGEVVIEAAGGCGGGGGARRRRYDVKYFFDVSGSPLTLQRLPSTASTASAAAAAADADEDGLDSPLYLCFDVNLRNRANRADLVATADALKEAFARRGALGPPLAQCGGGSNSYNNQSKKLLLLRHVRILQPLDVKITHKHKFIEINLFNNEKSAIHILYYRIYNTHARHNLVLNLHDAPSAAQIGAKEGTEGGEAEIALRAADTYTIIMKPIIADASLVVKWRCRGDVLISYFTLN